MYTLDLGFEMLGFDDNLYYVGIEYIVYNIKKWYMMACQRILIIRVGWILDYFKSTYFIDLYLGNVKNVGRGDC